MGARNVEWLKKGLLRVAKACFELIAHSLIFAVMFVAFWGIEHLVDVLWGSQRLMFGVIPFTSLIDAADIVMFLSLLWCGVTSAVKAYRGED